MKPRVQAGYSKRTLRSKLGIRKGDRIALLDPPEGYVVALALDAETELSRRLLPRLDLIQVFVKDSKTLARLFPRLKAAAKPEGVVWVSWPKKASGVETDLSDSVVRRAGLENGLVDVKVCAIDQTWSGLKFVRRADDRRPLQFSSR